MKETEKKSTVLQPPMEKLIQARMLKLLIPKLLENALDVTYMQEHYPTDYLLNKNN